MFVVCSFAKFLFILQMWEEQNSLGVIFIIDSDVADIKAKTETFDYRPIYFCFIFNLVT